MEENESVTLGDFYLKGIKGAEQSEVFVNNGLESVFAILCTDENQEHRVINKKSYARAKKVFKFDAKHQGLTDKLIHDIYNREVNASIDTNFFGFISEDVMKKVLLPNQWLARCDDEGFVITISTQDPAEGGDPKIHYEHHRVVYDEVTTEYVLTYNGETTRFFAWETLVNKMNAIATSALHAPLIICLEDTVVYNWREGEYDIIAVWLRLINAQYNYYLQCLTWYCAVVSVKDPKNFFNYSLSQVFSIRNPHDVINIINFCIARGADLNNEYCPVYHFAASYCPGAAAEIADHIWKLGADPNVQQKGVPAFFVAAKKNRRANAFIRNPKLDINMEIEPGMNVAWYLLTDIDHAIFDDKRFHINVIRQDKSLLDIGIECLDIPYIRKLVSAGIDMKRPSCTNLGTYLHAFLAAAKIRTDEEIIGVINVMIEAGIDVHTLNSNYQTPLHIATAHLTPGVVRELIVTQKANPNGHQESDTTPLHIAAERGDVNVVNALIELGADPLLRNTRGQLPKDAALYAVKALFCKGEKLPDYKFTAIKVALTNPSHPQFRTNLAIIDDHLYAHAGSYFFVNWWDEYGYMTIQTFQETLQKFERLPLDDILDKSKTRTWEELPSSSLCLADDSNVETFLKVNNKLWFHGKENWVIFDPETKTWTQGVRRDRFCGHRPYQTPHFNYYDNKIMFPKQSEMRSIDKTSGAITSVPIDQGDYNVDDTYRHGVLQDNTYWFVAKKALYALNIELRRNFKVFEFDFWLRSSLVCFGNRFLISSVVVDFATDQKLFILDLHTMSYALHEIQYDVVPEKDFNVIEDTKVNRAIPSGEAEETVHSSREKLHHLLANKKLPFDQVAMVIHQTTLLMYGGSYDHMLSHSHLFAVDLSRLVPYLSLEHQAALKVLNNNKVAKGKLLQLSEDLRTKLGLN